MITYKTGKLMAFKDHYEIFADIGLDAVGKPVDETLRGLKIFALRGMDCVIAYDGDTIIGYTIYGAVEKFVQWSQHMPLLLCLRAEGIKRIFTVTNIHFRKEYWGSGVYLGASRTYTADMIERNMSHMLLWGYATDQLAAYSLKQAGGRHLDGTFDPNGRQVGVRDLPVYMAASAP